MGFLDNSGDIILDAVLTDTGRFRLAKGDGSFKIAKFALGDEEINYELYDKTNASGSAYYDLSILQTPVLEAFTNNASTMKTKLISISRNNLLYLPVIKINDLQAGSAKHTSGVHIVAVDKDTEDSVGVSGTTKVAGILFGETPSDGGFVRLDQGLDTTEISPAFTIDSDVVETQYIVEIDNRLANLVSAVDSSRATVSFIDDDSLATYVLDTSDLDYVKEITNRTADPASMVIGGPRGTYLQLKLQASIDLNTSTYLFTTLGSVATIGSTSCYIIDSNVRVMGATTGFTLDIPIRFAKKV